MDDSKRFRPKRPRPETVRPRRQPPAGGSARRLNPKLDVMRGRNTIEQQQRLEELRFAILALRTAADATLKAQTYDAFLAAQRDFDRAYRFVQSSLREVGKPMPDDVVELYRQTRTFQRVGDAFYELRPGERDLEMALQQLDRETWR